MNNDNNIQDQINPFSFDDVNDINTSDDHDNDINIDNSSIDNNIESVMQINDDNSLNNHVQSDIIKMDEDIDNINLFIKHMEQRGYQLESSRFLTKKFAESSDVNTIYNINITINNEVITAITGYDDNNKVITIPEAIINTVKTDINKALQTII